ncbi:hypothetical protein ACJA3S_06555 [Pseudomonas sp. KnCO4]|uniref:hypothetical protein n=1 Tax=Pseudomonas sp. KnCO4 TaxID=3381355 RepID=UPI0038782989
MKLSVLVVFSMVTLTLSGFAQAQNNVATVTVDNQTDSTAQFTFEHLVGTANPMFSAVQRKQASTSKVTSYSPWYQACASPTRPGRRLVGFRLHTPLAQVIRLSGTKTLAPLAHPERRVR